MTRYKLEMVRCNPIADQICKIEALDDETWDSYTVCTFNLGNPVRGSAQYVDRMNLAQFVVIALMEREKRNDSIIATYEEKKAAIVNLLTGIRKDHDSQRFEQNFHLPQSARIAVDGFFESRARDEAEVIAEKILSIIGENNEG